MNALVKDSTSGFNISKYLYNLKNALYSKVTGSFTYLMNDFYKVILFTVFKSVLGRKNSVCC